MAREQQQSRRRPGKPEEKIGPISRRNFLRLSGSLLGAGVAYWTLRPTAVAAGVLPPGALPEADFLAACLRCGRCAAICDQTAIQIGFDGRPYLNGLSGWCDFCMLCVDVCPTAALLSVDPDATKLGTAEINRDRCLAWNIWGACQLCFQKCNDLQQAIWTDEDRQPHVDPDLCNGCGACVYVCPRPAHDHIDKKYGKAMTLQTLQE